MSIGSATITTTEENEETIKQSYWHYYWKSFKWFLGNLVFGLIPVLLLLLVRYLTDGGSGSGEIGILIHEGVIHFLCIALMGAVLTESLLSGAKSSGIGIFALYMFPLLVLSFVSLEYLLVFLNKMNNACFEVTSPPTIIVFLLSFGYCSFGKASSYMDESTKKM